jgi:Tfp pilus assembly protein PilO
VRPLEPDHKLKLFGWWLHGLGVAVTLFLMLFAEWFVYGPTDRRAAASARRTGELQALLRDEDPIRAEHARLTDELAAAREESAGLQKRIPNEPREGDFLAQVSQLAGDVGLNVRDYRPGAITAKPDYSHMQVELVCEGDYASICRFLAGLSELPRHSTVIRLQLDGDGSQPLCVANVSLRVYFTGRLSINERYAANE